MGLSESNSAQENDVGFVFEEGQAKEVLDLGPIEFPGPIPVELVEGFNAGETSGGDATLDRQLVPALGLTIDEPRQIINVRPLLGCDRN